MRFLGIAVLLVAQVAAAEVCVLDAGHSCDVNERSTVFLTSRFWAPKLCVGGTSNGAVCSIAADCPGGGTCTESSVTPTAVSTQVNAYTGTTAVSLMAASKVTGANPHTVTIPSTAQRCAAAKCVGGPTVGALCAVTADCGSGGVCRCPVVGCEPHTVTQQWWWQCQGGTNPGAACDEDSDCTGSGTCWRGTFEGTLKVCNLQAIQD